MSEEIEVEVSKDRENKECSRREESWKCLICVDL